MGLVLMKLLLQLGVLFVFGCEGVVVVVCRGEILIDTGFWLCGGRYQVNVVGTVWVMISFGGVVFGMGFLIELKSMDRKLVGFWIWKRRWPMDVLRLIVDSGLLICS